MAESVLYGWFSSRFLWWEGWGGGWGVLCCSYVALSFSFYEERGCVYSFFLCVRVDLGNA